MNQVFQILINGGIFLSVFIIVLLQAKGIRKTRANIFLSILLASLAFSVFHLRYAGDVIHHFSIRAYPLGDPTFLVIAPFLWFYISELSGDRVQLKLATVLHFVPFIAFVFCSISFRSFLNSNPVIDILQTHPRLAYITFWTGVVIQFSLYQFFIYLKWRKYQAKVKQEVSNTENISISWVQFFIGVFLVINICFLVSLFAVIHFDVMNLVWKLAGAVFSLSIFALGYKGILQREVFASEEVVPEIPIELQEKPDNELIERLIRFMIEKRPFIDPELTLSSLAAQIGLSRNELSQLINNGLNENFYDFVNKYRVEEVKKLMIDPKKQNYNLMGIATEAGFKSKSTFNLIFKRFTGLTPTEYRKNNLQ